MKRCAIYTRVSTKDQTVENQLIVLKEVAKLKGYKVVKEYTDEGVSGAKGRDKRTGFDTLIKDATKKDFDIILSWSVDRLGRNLSHLVSFLNEMKRLNDKIGGDWDVAIEGFVRDGRVGHSHVSVPGPDGKLGFGGSCFPKDIQAIIHLADQLDLDLHTLRGAWKTNLEVRPEKDWKKLKGRSIV